MIEIPTFLFVILISIVGTCALFVILAIVTSVIENIKYTRMTKHLDKLRKEVEEDDDL